MRSRLALAWAWHPAWAEAHATTVPHPIMKNIQKISKIGETAANNFCDG